MHFTKRHRYNITDFISIVRITSNKIAFQKTSMRVLEI